MTATYRTYLRLPRQRAAEKTTTPHRDLAEEALRRIVRDHRHGAAVLTVDGENLLYIPLPALACERCGYIGEDDQGACPRCHLE